ncbi:GTPase domain-containing protein [Cellulomonas sp. PhB143]|uniref:GTPase domain-containing protein n=1 Tax=Cellulomonas sp. PhB143 TaxID=2485186 RepID=UPI000F98E321|nr:GTPase domain-containing protein [Cellulomonas sp. PhB143]ROS77043.1 50S ribosome-binding GTPase [Cellulomonas sp. PhB143]
MTPRTAVGNDDPARPGGVERAPETPGAAAPGPATSTPTDRTEHRLGTTVHDVARDLRAVVAGVDLPLPLEGAQEAAASRDRLVVQLDEHLLPRLKELSSPALVVLAGSTGAGKSTLYNSILGEEVSVAGVLRPTTREPVLAHHPEDVDVLVTGPATQAARTIAHDAVPRGVAFVDAPDLDSLLAENRATAGRLLEAADLWLFATTAARYGDALPWQALAKARERGASVALVLNRVPRENLVTIRADLLQRLRDHGMDNVPLFVVPDAGPHEGLLEADQVAPITRWLHKIGGPERSRSVIVRTLKGSLAALPGWVTGIADAVDAQGEAARVLRARLDDVVPRVAATAQESLVSGRVGSGPVASLWTHSVTGARVDRIRLRAGVARSSARQGRRRERDLEPLRAGLADSLVRALVAAAAEARAAATRALTGPDAPAGAAGLVATWDEDPEAARTSDSRERAEAWLAAADDAADALAGSPAGDAARTAFGRRGLGTLLAAAAAGTDDARRLVARVLDGQEVAAVEALRDALGACARPTVEAEVAGLRSALDAPAFADGAGAALRVRLAELRRMV